MSEGEEIEPATFYFQVKGLTNSYRTSFNTKNLRSVYFQS